MKLKLTLLLLIFSNTFYLSAQTQIGIDIDGVNEGDNSGSAVSISADGNRIAIGAPFNEANGTDAGHTRVFELNDNEWIQLGNDINGENSIDAFGQAVSISAEGTRVIIGAPQNDDIGMTSGHARIYEWNNNQWTQLGNDLDGESAGDRFGIAVSISADGNRVAIGGVFNDGNGNDSGHARIFEWKNNQWIQMGQDIDGENPGDLFGRSISISDDGNNVAIGAYLNSENGNNSGHTRIFEWNNNQWIQKGQDIDGENGGDSSGFSVSISDDGNKVAIGSIFNDDNGSSSGHTRIFEWNNNQWTQLGQNIIGENAEDQSGFSVSISDDGNKVAIGAYQNENNGYDSGQARIFEWTNNQWTQLGSNTDGENAGDFFGLSVSISADGNSMAVGGPRNDDNGVNSGHVRIFDFGNPDLTSNNLCFTLDYNTNPNQYILEGDFTNCNIFVLDENENVIQFLLNIFDKIIIDLEELPDGLHFIRVEHQQFGELFIQEIIKQ